MPETINVRPWQDPVIDTLGHDPRSLYVEMFWLPTLGPTSLLLLRLLAKQFEAGPGGEVQLPAAETSQALGIGLREGNNSPLRRTFARLEKFDLAQLPPTRDWENGVIAVRRSIPPVNRRHIRRLPENLREAHEEWVTARIAEPPLASARRNAKRMAFTLIELGDDLDRAERALFSAGFHPSICREASVWAWQRHGGAYAAAGQTALGATA